MVEQRRNTLVSGDSTHLVYRSWTDEESRAAVAFVHGLGGHALQPTYRYFIERITEGGYSVFGLDLRGHGESSGRRGHVARWQDLIDDVALFVSAVGDDSRGAPRFLFGQSLGGLVVLDYAMQFDGQAVGVIVSAPALQLPRMPAWQPPILRFLSHVAPAIPLPSPVDVTTFSRDPEEVAALQADTLHHRTMTARFATEYEHAVERIQANAGSLHVPLLTIYGTADPLVPPDGAIAFHERAASTDKTLIAYDGNYHQPIIDLDRKQVVDDIIDWIGEHSHSRGEGSRD